MWWLLWMATFARADYMIFLANNLDQFWQLSIDEIAYHCYIEAHDLLAVESDVCPDFYYNLTGNNDTLPHGILDYAANEFGFVDFHYLFYVDLFSPVSADPPGVPQTHTEQIIEDDPNSIHLPDGSIVNSWAELFDQISGTFPKTSHCLNSTLIDSDPLYWFRGRYPPPNENLCVGQTFGQAGSAGFSFDCNGNLFTTDQIAFMCFVEFDASITPTPSSSPSTLPSASSLASSSQTPSTSSSSSTSPSPSLTPVPRKWYNPRPETQWTYLTMTFDTIAVSSRPHTGPGNQVWRLPWNDPDGADTIDDPDQNSDSGFGHQLSWSDTLYVADTSYLDGLGTVYRVGPTLTHVLADTADLLVAIEGVTSDLTEMKFGTRLASYGPIVAYTNADPAEPIIVIQAVGEAPHFGWFSIQRHLASIDGLGSVLALWEHRLVVAGVGGISQLTPRSTCCDVDLATIATWPQLTLTTLPSLVMHLEPQLLLAFRYDTQTLRCWTTDSTAAPWTEVDGWTRTGSDVVASALVQGYLSIIDAQAQFEVWRVATWELVSVTSLVTTLIDPPWTTSDVALTGATKNSTWRWAWLQTNQPTTDSVRWIEVELDPASLPVPPLANQSPTTRCSWWLVMVLWIIAYVKMRQ